MKVPVLRRTETPGVVFAIAKAISQAARTADGTAGGLATFVWAVAWLEAIRKRGTDAAKKMRCLWGDFMLIPQRLRLVATGIVALRHVAGACPTSFLNARLNAASDS